jgi:GrpB-like predicted nucleotidyltransferase (UPF0157 family)
LSELGLQHGEVVLAPWSPVWRRVYSRKERRLRAALGSRLLDIQHVGSTAVHGLSAQPIIAIAILVQSLSAARRFLPLLADLGYIHKHNSTHDDRLFSTNGREVESFYIHCFEARAFARVVLFRDALRRSSALRRDDGALKRRLAMLFADDRSRYTAGRAAFIERVLGSAAGSPRRCG